MAAGRLDVVPADNELRLLRAIAQPNNQATTMFALIGAMVGFLLTFNAMLLTVPERRRYIADLRMQGYDWRQALLITGFEALVLGVVGIDRWYRSRLCAVAHVVSSGPRLSGIRLSSRRPASSCRCRSSCWPLFAECLRHCSHRWCRYPIYGQGARAMLSCGRPEGPARASVDEPQSVFGIAGLLLIALASVLVLIDPSLTLIGGAALALATLCLIPVAFAGAAQVLRGASEHIPSSALVLAVRELRTTSMPLVALAGVGALAIYGSVAIGGARHDLLTGLDTNFREYLGTADVWVTTGGNDLTTNSFQAPGLQAKLAESSGSRSVRVYQGELMDVGSRRMWVIARPPGDGTIIPASQLLDRQLAHDDELLRGSGWAAISTSFAVEHHLRVGNGFALPTPSGTRSSESLRSPPTWVGLPVR